MSNLSAPQSPSQASRSLATTSSSSAKAKQPSSPLPLFYSSSPPSTAPFEALTDPNSTKHSEENSAQSSSSLALVKTVSCPSSKQASTLPFGGVKIDPYYFKFSSAELKEFDLTKNEADLIVQFLQKDTPTPLIFDILFKIKGTSALQRVEIAKTMDEKQDNRFFNHCYQKYAERIKNKGLPQSALKTIFYIEELLSNQDPDEKVIFPEPSFEKSADSIAYYEKRHKDIDLQAKVAPKNKLKELLSHLMDHIYDWYIKEKMPLSKFPLFQVFFNEFYNAPHFIEMIKPHEILPKDLLLDQENLINSPLDGRLGFFLDALELVIYNKEVGCFDCRNLTYAVSGAITNFDIKLLKLIMQRYPLHINQFILGVSDAAYDMGGWLSDFSIEREWEASGKKDKHQSGLPFTRFIQQGDVILNALYYAFPMIRYTLNEAIKLRSAHINRNRRTRGIHDIIYEQYAERASGFVKEYNETFKAFERKFKTINKAFTLAPVPDELKPYMFKRNNLRDVNFLLCKEVYLPQSFFSFLFACVKNELF